MTKEMAKNVLVSHRGRGSPVRGPGLALGRPGGVRAGPLRRPQAALVRILEVVQAPGGVPLHPPLHERRGPLPVRSHHDPALGAGAGAGAARGEPKTLDRPCRTPRPAPPLHLAGCCHKNWALSSYQSLD